MTSPRPDRLYLGYQYATLQVDPGPPPRRPTPPEHERLSPDWATAQRREENLLNRPLKATFGVAVVIDLRGREEAAAAPQIKGTTRVHLPIEPTVVPELLAQLAAGTLSADSAIAVLARGGWTREGVRRGRGRPPHPSLTQESVSRNAFATER